MKPQWDNMSEIRSRGLPVSIEFLRSHGFLEDPFASTNAADEPLIEQYFVYPPFFPAVVGDPSSPKSNVVFAPRGGGKTAQKIMIEKRAAEDPTFLCITYDKFPLEGIRSPKDAKIDYHISNMCRILLVAILVRLEERKYTPTGFNDVDRQLIVGPSRKLLGALSSERFKEALSSVKSITDKTADIFNRYGGTVVGLLNAVSAKYGFGKIDAIAPGGKPIDETLRFQFESLITLARKFGFRSTYILVDRVDELPMTASDASKAFDFLESLLIDLPLLETDGVAFKFFLWDKTKEDYQSAGGRPDRLIEYSLRWSVKDFDTVLSRRMQAYSNKEVSRFDQLVSTNIPYDIHALISYFAHGSPRDMVRICKRIVDEHTRTGRYQSVIEFRTIKQALANFSAERARELYGSIFGELRRVKELNFTTNSLANNVFRITTQAARSKVQKWQNSGAVQKIGEVPNPGNRPHYLYGVVDPRLAIAVMNDTSLEESLENYLVICPHCEALRIVEEDDITCPDCHGVFKADKAVTVAYVCRKY